MGGVLWARYPWTPVNGLVFHAGAVDFADFGDVQDWVAGLDPKPS